jgi:signal transduction histidine kinase
MGAASERLRRTMEGAPPAHRAGRFVAWALGTTSGLLLLAAGILAVTEEPSLEIPGAVGALAALLALTIAGSFAVIGLVLTLRVPSNPIGWLFGGIGLLIALVVLGASIGESGRPDSVRVWGAWLSSWTGASVVPMLALVALLFPDGRPLNRRWRVVTRIAIGFVIVFALIVALVPGEMDGTDGLVNPVGIKALDSELFGIFWIGLPVLLIATGASLVIRFRRSSGVERKQIELLALSAGLLAATSLLNVFAYGSSLEGISIVLQILAVGLFPILAAVAILRHRLYDIDVVIRKTVVYAILAGLILAITIGFLVVLSGRFVGNRSEAVAVAAFAVGLLVWPLRGVATLIADRVVFGGRATPYEALTRFTQKVGAIAADDALPAVAEAVGRATGARVARVWLLDGDVLHPVASWPSGADAVTAVAETDLDDRWLGHEDGVRVMHQGELMGAISVSMPANDPMNASKQALIDDLAAEAGPVIRNTRLVRDLRESRRRIVAAQDERAKKLERNIHDGAQQQLVAMAVKQRLAASLIGKDDARATEMLAELQEDTTDALENLRALARGIYPPLLADEGLAAAVEASARRSSVPVEVEADGLGRYSQDVEAAVYFVVLEALQNVAKYAEASEVHVHLAETDHELAFEVKDDGRGFEQDAVKRGSGLQGMTDRIDAIGGSIEVRSRPGGGTSIIGRLPV